MHSTRFLDESDLPLTAESGDDIYERAVFIDYNGDYSGDIYLRSSQSGQEQNAITDFKTMHFVALDPDSASERVFTNEDNTESVSMPVKDIRSFVAEAYRSEAIRAVESMTPDDVLSNNWMRSLTANLPI